MITYSIYLDSWQSSSPLSVTEKVQMVQSLFRGILYVLLHIPDHGHSLYIHIVLPRPERRLHVTMSCLQIGNSIYVGETIFLNTNMHLKDREHVNLHTQLRT